MADPRDFNFWRKRHYGSSLLTLGRVLTDTTDELYFSSDDFGVSEIRDEETGRMIFEFRLFDYLSYNQTQVKQADLFIYRNERMERLTFEEKKFPSVYWKVTAVRFGVQP